MSERPKIRTLSEDKKCHSCGKLMSAGSEYAKINLGESTYARCCVGNEICESKFTSGKLISGTSKMSIPRSKTPTPSRAMPIPHTSRSVPLSRPPGIKKPPERTPPTHNSPAPRRSNSLHGPWHPKFNKFWYSDMWFAWILDTLYLNTMLTSWTFGYYAYLHKPPVDPDNLPGRVIILEQTDYFTIKTQKELINKLIELNKDLNLEKEQWVPKFNENNTDLIKFVKIYNPKFKHQ